MIADSERKIRLLERVNVGHRLEADKMDVLLTVRNGNQEKLIGVVHVKASFVERRTDDVPISQALVAAGYISPLWTMDCKTAPSARPINRENSAPSTADREQTAGAPNEKTLKMMGSSRRVSLTTRIRYLPR